MPSPSLEQLFAAFLATGDEAALEQLMRRSAPALRRLASRLGATADDAEDLVQETIVAAIQGADRYDPARPLMPWLKGILTLRSARLARDAVRRRRHYAQSASADADRDRDAYADPEAALAGRELDHDVRRAIASLPVPYQAPLQQYLFAGRSPLEIAHGLGLQRATVRVRLHRGLQRLRERLLGWVSLLLAVLLGRPARAAAGAVRRAPLAAAALCLAIGAVLAFAWRAGPEVAPVPVVERVVAGTGADAADDPSADAAPRTLAGAAARVADTAALRVQVVGSDARPLPAAGIVLVPAAGVDPVLHRRRAVTDAEGVAGWSALTPGRYELHADRGPRVAIELHAGANTQRIAVVGGRTVGGRVVDAEGRPVAGAAVWLGCEPDGPWRGDDVATSAADGTFVLHQVPDGAFVAARHERFARSDVRQVAGAATDVVVTLGQPGGRVDVLVQTEHGAAIAGAQVFVGDTMDTTPLWLAQGAAPWRAPPCEGRTDANGCLRTPAFAVGRQPVSVRVAGRTPFTGWVDVKPDTVATCVVRLPRGPQLHGTVVGGDGAPIDGAQVVFRSDELSQWVDITTGADGRFRFESLPAAGGDFAARARGHAACMQSLELASGQVTERRIVLAAARVVRGALHGVAAAIVAGAVVRARWQPSTLESDEARAVVDADGRFTFDATRVAIPLLELRLRGEPLWRRVDAMARWNEGEVRLDLDGLIAASAWLEGTLADAVGQPFAAARLFVCRDGVQWAEIGRSDARGAFRLGPLPAGRYDLFAESTVPGMPSALVTTVDLVDGVVQRVDATLPPAGRLDVTFARGDGASPGDLAWTVTGRDLPRRFALGSGDRVQQALLPGDYLVHVMGGHVQWRDGLPVRIEAGATTTQVIELQPAARCSLALRGLPPVDDPAPAQFRLRERWRGDWSTTFTLLADAARRVCVMLAPGDYVLEHEDPSGRLWQGTFAAGAEPATITVQLAPAQKAKPIVK